MAMRAVVYIDGLNFHYGALRGAPHLDWLDFQSLMQRIRSDDEILRIHYFTSPLLEEGLQDRQSQYLGALNEYCPLVEIHFGKHIRRSRRIPLHPGPLATELRVSWFQEKQTDVAIGVQMVRDALTQECEHLILVSRDSDLVPAVRAVHRWAPDKRVLLYYPATEMHKRGGAADLKKASHRAKRFPAEFLQGSQMPDKVGLANGLVVRRPPSAS